MMARRESRRVRPIERRTARSCRRRPTVVTRAWATVATAIEGEEHGEHDRHGEDVAETFDGRGQLAAARRTRLPTPSGGRAARWPSMPSFQRMQDVALTEVGAAAEARRECSLQSGRRHPRALVVLGVRRRRQEHAPDDGGGNGGAGADERSRRRCAGRARPSSPAPSPRRRQRPADGPRARRSRCHP